MIEAGQTLLNFGNSGVSWFPQEYAHMFFVIKGIMSLLGMIGLVVHMTYIWNHKLPESSAQQWRYLALLSYAVLGSAATLQQVKDRFPVHYANLGVLLCIVLLFVAVTKSLKGDWEHYRRYRNDPDRAQPHDLPRRQLQPPGRLQDKHPGRGGPGSSRSDWSDGEGAGACYAGRHRRAG